MKRRKKTNGSNRLLLIALAGLWGLSGLANRGDASPKPKAPAPYAVIAGTIFRESGFSLPGAAVTLAPRDVPKSKKLQSTSDARGEFAFRVPASPATYIVKASLKGFQTTEKEVSVSGDGRVDVMLTLPQVSK